jgi:hypothetical protein
VDEVVSAEWPLIADSVEKPVPSNNAIFSEALVRSWSLDPHSLEAEISSCHELQIRIDAAPRGMFGRQRRFRGLTAVCTQGFGRDAEAVTAQLLAVRPARSLTDAARQFCAGERRRFPVPMHGNPRRRNL